LKGFPGMPLSSTEEVLESRRLFVTTLKSQNPKIPILKKKNLKTHAW